MRTRKEIIARIEELVPSHIDPFGVMVGLLVFFLRYGDAQRFLKAEVTQEEWSAKHKHPLTEERVRFLIHAGTRASWVAANRRQGVDVNKGFMVLEALCWLLGPKEHAWVVDLFWTHDKMAHYGKPQLVEMHAYFKLGPWRELDDGLWHNTALNMDLDPDSALRQWHAKWDRTQVGRNGQG